MRVTGLVVSLLLVAAFAGAEQLTFSTYLGGGGTDSIDSVAIDDAGNVYVGGYSTSSDFPLTRDAYRTSPAGMFIAKLDASGALEFSTFFGGLDGSDRLTAIATDSAGNFAVVGYTYSDDFPVKAAMQTVFGGGNDTFVTKFDHAGRIVFSTFLGGSGTEIPTGVTFDGAGNLFVVGRTSSRNFPLKNPVQATFGGQEDGFLAKISPTGEPSFMTLFGGRGFDAPFGVAADRTGSAYILVDTTSADYPGVPIADCREGASEFPGVAKFDGHGALVYSVQLKGCEAYARSITVNHAGEAFISGITPSRGLPTTPNAMDPDNSRGVPKHFIIKFAADGLRILYASYFGNANSTPALASSVSSVVMVGGTTATDFTVTPNALSLTRLGPSDAFMTRFSDDGERVLFSTYFGGTSREAATSVSANGQGLIAIAGTTDSIDFPTVRPYQAKLVAGTDGFVSVVRLPTRRRIVRH